MITIKKLLDDWKDVLSRYANITFLHNRIYLQFDNLQFGMQILCQKQKNERHLPLCRHRSRVSSILVCGLLLEDQLCKLEEAATPGVPLMSSSGRLITYGVDTDGLDILGCLDATHVLLATTAHEE